MELVASAGKAPQPHTLKTMVRLQVRKAHLDLLALVTGFDEPRRTHQGARCIPCVLMHVRKSSRYGHRDATMIQIGYRHGLRASELCDLQWSQVELATGRLHVRRAKNGSPSVVCGL